MFDKCHRVHWNRRKTNTSFLFSLALLSYCTFFFTQFTLTSFLPCHLSLCQPRRVPFSVKIHLWHRTNLVSRNRSESRGRGFTKRPLTTLANTRKRGNRLFAVFRVHAKLRFYFQLKPGGRKFCCRTLGVEEFEGSFLRNCFRQYFNKLMVRKYVNDVILSKSSLH